jgi:hypothetical protein
MNNCSTAPLPRMESGDSQSRSTVIGGSLGTTRMREGVEEFVMPRRLKLGGLLWLNVAKRIFARIDKSGR